MDLTLFENLQKLIQKSQDILIIPHVDPDADAFGSAYSLALALEKMKKNVHVGLNVQDDQQNEFFFPFEKKFAIYNFEKFYDLMISVDCGGLNRLGKYASYFQEAKVQHFVNIDHHIDNSSFAELNIVYPDFSSTCEIVTSFLKFLNISFNFDIASLLYAGILYDTGCFKYSVTSRTHNFVADLLQYKVDTQYIHSILFEHWKPETLNVLSKVYSTLEMNYNGQIALTYLKRDFYNDKSELTNFVKIGLSIKGVLVSIHMIEKRDSLIQVSLRSRKKNIPINHIAALYNGGGHANAAGFIIENTFEEAKKFILVNILPKIKNQIDKSSKSI